VPTLLIALLVAKTEGWNAMFFENVHLHRGSPAVTVEVAWLEPKPPISTASAMPCVISIFTKGSKTPLVTKRIGEVPLFYENNGPEIATDPRSGESFLSLPMMVPRPEGGNLYVNTAVYRFDGNQPIRAMLDFSLSPKHDKPGAFGEWKQAHEIGFKTAPGRHPDPMVERTLWYDAKTRTFKPTAWHEVPFDKPTSLTLRGKSGTHTFTVQLRKRNFQLGNRKVSFRNRQLYLGGLKALGQDMGSFDELHGRDLRTLFMMELTSFRVWIDGKEIPVPSAIWRNCFDLHFHPRYTTARLSRDGTKLKVSIMGADGGGSYAADWTISSSGVCKRGIRYLD
jgi:hypothetical protein